MLRKFVCAAVVVVAALGVAMADDFTAIITKVDGDKVTFKKFQKGEGPGEEKTLPVTKDAKIMKGKFNKDEGKVAATDAIEGGLKNDMFKIKLTDEGKGGVFANITTDKDNKNITAITTMQFGGGKGKGFKKKDAN